MDRVDAVEVPRTLPGPPAAVKVAATLDPAAAVRIGRRRHLVTATELHGDTAEQARRHVLAKWPETARYERMSGRPIPYFRLDPVQPDSEKNPGARDQLAFPANRPGRALDFQRRG